MIKHQKNSGPVNNKKDESICLSHRCKKVLTFLTLLWCSLAPSMWGNTIDYGDLGPVVSMQWFSIQNILAIKMNFTTLNAVAVKTGWFNNLSDSALCINPMTSFYVLCGNFSHVHMCSSPRYNVGWGTFYHYFLAGKVQSRQVDNIGLFSLVQISSLDLKEDGAVSVNKDQLEKRKKILEALLRTSRENFDSNTAIIKFIESQRSCHKKSLLQWLVTEKTHKDTRYQLDKLTLYPTKDNLIQRTIFIVSIFRPHNFKIFICLSA